MKNQSATVPFQTLIRAEILKYRGTALWGVSIVLPTLFVSGYLAIGLFFGSRFIPSSQDPWFAYTSRIMAVYIGFMFILQAIVTSALATRVEHHNATWKHLLTQPVSKASIFAAKGAGLALLLLASLLLFLVEVYASGILYGMMHPEVGLSFPGNVLRNCAIIIVGWLAVLGMTSIQFMVAMRWSHVAVPLAVGFIGYASCFILGQQDPLLAYLPYVMVPFTIGAMLNDPSLWLPEHAVASVGMSLVPVMLAWRHFRSKNWE